MTTRTPRPAGRSSSKNSSAARTPAAKNSSAVRTPAAKKPSANSDASKAASTRTAVTKKPAARRNTVQLEPRRGSVDWRSLYLYAVSLITLLICLFAVVSLIRAGLNLAFPSTGYLDPYAPKSEIDPEQIRRAQLDADRRNALRSILDNTTMLIVTAPLYRYHWRAAQRERE